MESRNRVLAVLALLLAMAGVGRAELKITGLDKAQRREAVILKLEGAKLGEPFDFFVTPPVAMLAVMYDHEGTPMGVFQAGTDGVYTTCGVKFNTETKKLERTLHAITVGPIKPPPPPQPDPPTPDPEPDPTPDPPTPGGFRVLMLEEAAERSRLPAGQLAAMTSSAVRNYLDAKTAKTADGKPEWRLWDDDVSTANVAANWQAAMAKAKADSGGRRPWLIVSDGNKGESCPLPASEADLMKLLKKYGGD